MSTAPPPSSTIQWTQAQQAAIQTRGCDLVVSASAGSGKTAVLTERVLRLVTEPVSTPGATTPGEPAARIEELLIITFTEKAARQMRERIESRIRRELEAKPDSHALRAAYDGLSGGWIMTIDAFCRRLVTQHFHEAGVSPAPRIPDGAELADLERESLAQLLEEWAAAPARRAALGELIGSCALKADGLAADVRKLIGFLQSLDRPRSWLDRVRQGIEQTARAQKFADLPEARAVAASFKNATREIADALRELAGLAEARGGDGEKIAEWRRLAGELGTVAENQVAFRPDPLRAWLEEEVDATLAKLKNKGVCGDVLYKDDAFKKNFLERFSKHYERWRDLWLALDEAGLLRGAQLSAAQCATLLDLAQEAMARIERVKQRRGLLTFNDFERLTLQILSDPALPDAPSEIAWRLRRQFKFVLVDEYQDTSPLQDAIVRRVARSDDPGEEPNLFLVGDIKQSIYRFRHAEPGLFLAKMRAAEQEGARARRINLHENFRSRPAILEFINHCFEGIMDAAVGELDYHGGERLQPGRGEAPGGPAPAVEVQWLPKNGQDAAGEPEDGTPDDENAQDGNPDESNQGEGAEALEGVAAQAHWVARRIRELTDPERGILIPGEAPAPRRARPGDCAILLRGIRGELEVWTQSLEREGLKVRAPGVNPLFSTSEMLDLLSALRVADHPFQDIPLAALMRSPLAGFSDDELLAIRMQRRRGPFYGAVWEVAGRPLPDEEAPACAPPPEAPPPQPEVMDGALRRKVTDFVERVDGWRRFARQGGAYELLGLILRETGYEAFLLGHLDGLARIGHLDFLRGLLLRLGRGDEGQNPLAAFLELTRRAETEEGEVGELPETIANQLDAVNLLTIHRAKGLEFPIVFLPRLERPFRTRKPGETLFDHELGITRGGVDVARRRRYPTLAQRAMIDRLQRKDRSEEIRLLYVALTRARERLVLVGQPGGLGQLGQRWGTVLALGGRPAGALDRLHARTPADLLGPIVQWLASGAGQPWLTLSQRAELGTRGAGDAWSRARDLLAELEAAPNNLNGGNIASGNDITTGNIIAMGEFPAGGADIATGHELSNMNETPVSAFPFTFLPPHDPGAALAGLPTKTSVTRLKKQESLLHGAPQALLSGAAELAREEERFIEAEMAQPFFARQGRLADRRPAWLEETPKVQPRLGADRRGTLTHAVLAHADLRGALDLPGLRAQTARLIEAGLVGGAFEEKEIILAGLDFDALAWFFTSDLGRRLTADPRRVQRELAYTASKDLRDFDPEAKRYFPGERILVQGIVDAVIDDGPKATVIDYKTDRVRGPQHLAELVERYSFQIEQYAWALESIWQLKAGAVRQALVFLDARQVVWIGE